MVLIHGFRVIRVRKAGPGSLVHSSSAGQELFTEQKAESKNQEPSYSFERPGPYRPTSVSEVQRPKGSTALPKIVPSTGKQTSTT